MTIQIPIQEGTHTVSVYLPPEAIENTLGFCHDGVTFIFKMVDHTLETEFAKEGQYNKEQLHTLSQRAKKFLEGAEAS